MSTLAENAMLISLHISEWKAVKIDKDVTKEVQTQHGAKDAGSFNKILVDKKAVKDFQKILSEVRTYHYSNTLPWDNTGRRLITVEHYQEYVEKIREFNIAFDDAVELFISDYDKWVIDAQSRLGTMFSLKDYPSKSELRNKFGIKTSISEITDDTDLRVKVQEDQVEDIKKSVRADLNESISTATANIFDRIKDTVGHLYDKLSDTDSRFHESLIVNVQELINLLPKLNFTGNKQIQEACEDMKKLIVDADSVRKNPEFRENLANSASELLKKYGL